MTDLLDCIRVALAEGATLEQKQAGAAACCAALSPPPGVPLSVPHALSAGVNDDQVLELAITKLRTMLPADANVTDRVGALPVPRRDAVNATDTTTTAEAAEVMNAEEVAVFLRVDRKTVCDYAKRGQIPRRRLGKRLLFSRSALEAWLGDGTRSPGKASHVRAA